MNLWIGYPGGEIEIPLGEDNDVLWTDVTVRCKSYRTNWELQDESRRLAFTTKWGCDSCLPGESVACVASTQASVTAAS
jgi:hypothetical protein